MSPRGQIASGLPEELSMAQNAPLSSTASEARMSDEAGGDLLAIVQARGDPLAIVPVENSRVSIYNQSGSQEVRSLQAQLVHAHEIIRSQEVANQAMQYTMANAANTMGKQLKQVNIKPIPLSRD